MESRNSILQEDFDYVTNRLSLFDIRNSTILVTGATGLVGSNLIKLLLCINRKQNLNLKILACARNESKIKQILSEVLNREELKIILYDVNENAAIQEDVDYIIHTVSITNSKDMIIKPVETILTTVLGTKNILELAREKNVKKIIYISSMEMYGNVGQFMEEKEFITEEDVGYLDPLIVRNNYPESKRMAENLCVAYEKQYGVNVVIARLSQTFGAGILPTDNRVYAQFIKSVMNSENIVLHTSGNSDGNYCYLRDVLAALLILMKRGNIGEAYNICNEECHTTIKQMANMVSEKISKGVCKVIFDIPDSNIYGYAAETKMKLTSAKMRELGWAPTINLTEAYERTINYLAEQHQLEVY